MKKIISLSVFFGVIIFVSQSCGGGNEKTPATDSANKNSNVSAPMDGKSIYEGKCVICHGAEGNAGVMGAADLSKSSLTHDAACAIVKNGKNGMKSFSDQLSDAEIDGVVKYVEGLRK